MSQHYSRLAQACSLIYLMLQQLNEVHFLYQYSLDFLLEIFVAVLVTPQLKSVTDYEQRLKIIMSNLFQVNRLFCVITNDLFCHQEFKFIQFLIFSLDGLSTRFFGYVTPR